jgi:hypothetical protein
MWSELFKIEKEIAQNGAFVHTKSSLFCSIIVKGALSWCDMYPFMVRYVSFHTLKDGLLGLKNMDF